MYKWLFLSMLFLYDASFAQSSKKSDVEIAVEKGKEAIILMDRGATYEAIAILKKCQKLDPDQLSYPLQIAIGHYLNGSYRKAIDILENLKYHKDANALLYVMLYLCWQADGNEVRSVNYLNRGIQLFPQSGRLCLEQALYYYSKGDSSQCMYWLTTGVKVEPNFSTNHFYKAVFLANSNDRADAMAHAELYHFLSGLRHPPTQMGRLMYQLQTDTVRTIFRQGDTLGNAWLSRITKDRGPTTTDSICIKLLAAGRFSFYNSREPSVQQPLDRIHAAILKAGFQEAYLYWVSRYGDMLRFYDWRQENLQKWERFYKWYSRFVAEYSLSMQME